MTTRPPLVVTCGDPAGIGPDIILEAWSRRRFTAPDFYVLGDPDQLSARAALLGLHVPIVTIAPDEARRHEPAALAVVPLDNRLSERPGKPDCANAAGIVEAIDRGVADVMEGRASALVTCPIAKKPLYDAGFAFPGHTEYLAHLATRATGRATQAVMMIAGPDLRVVPVTIHIPLSEVPSRLTTELIVETGRVVGRNLMERFGLARPRLAVAGLNPHAGEDGSIGLEDREVIAPAVRILRSGGIDAFGPLPADTMFHARARGGYDAALCMYHDQALIPAKALAFDEAVNVTLGLPFIRTSPDHGTAFDIAGTGEARESSFVAALGLADAMAARLVERI